jgi:Flp pilus assembly protein TadG
MDGMGCAQKAARMRGDAGARGDRGAALVEMALIVPILGVLLFGIIEFGYLMSFRGGLAQAASEGARAAAVAVRTTNDVTAINEATAATNQAVANYGKTCGLAYLTCQFFPHDCSGVTQTAALPDCMTVTVTYDNAANPIMPEIPIISFAMPNTLTVSSTVQMNAS